MSSICVCVCTHDRPDGLQALLAALVPQLSAHKACLVVIDNGSSSAEAIVRAIPTEVDCQYIRLSEAGLVAARNQALLAARKTERELIAFVDDDEVPDPHWLASLVACLDETGSDICFGPLRPSYAIEPPNWARHGPFFWKTGETIGTGNMMMRAAIMPQEPSQWFQPAFAFLGGEDEEFFARLIRGGATIAKAGNAWVSERVPASRLTLSYVLSTGARDGAIEVALLRQRGVSAIGCWSTCAGHVVKKLAYILYHVVLAWRGSWHGVAALRDAAEIGGTLHALVGRTGTYYGKPTLTR